jgi:hypothetical protein
MRHIFRPLVPVVTMLLALAPMPLPAQTCTGLCLQQVTCPNPAVTTTVTGRVYAPNATLPLPGVLVYVPNGPVQALPAGATCRQGGTPPSSPLVQAITGVDGSFTLTNMPVGANIPLVIQTGKWRRQIVIPNVTACTNTPVSSVLSHLPKNRSEGDLPHIAIVTGNADAAECVFRKIGVDDVEFTGSSTGSIRLFTGAGSAGASLPGSPSETQLETSAAALGSYDMVVFACQGAAFTQSAAAKQYLVDYANAGGRVMATHYAYTWLYDYAPFSTTATWAVDSSPSPADQTAYVDPNAADGPQLAQWLQFVAATQTLGQLPLQSLRRDFAAAIAPSETWLNVADVNWGTTPVQYTFDAPVGAAPADQCGRVEFMDYHVENGSGTSSMTFPAECDASGLSAQEKLYAYMVFNLTNNPAPALILTIDDGRPFARYGHVANYTVHLANNTDTPTGSIAVTSTLSPGLDAANALCAGSGGATCTTSAAGGLTASATVAAYSTATWVISVPVLAGTGDATVEFDVSAAGATSAADVDALVLFHDGFNVPNADGTQ